MKQEWYKSWAVWASLAALVLLVLKKAFGIDLYGLWNEAAEALLEVLIAFGVVNNPNERKRLNIPAAEIKATKKVLVTDDGMHETEGDDNAADE